MTTILSQSDSFLIPLNLLVPSALNVRRTGGTNVDALASSIQSIGLLQNLTVSAKGKKYEVLAGGRRLLALRQLHKAGLIACDHEIRCEVRTLNDATEISTAENELREAMHPADQFAAFKAMADDNIGIEGIAAKFGVSTLVVRQRMKLASVAPALLQLYREGEATLEQMVALSITDDQAEQLRVWNGAQSGWQRDPSRLRSALTREEIQGDDKLAKYVGLEAYEQAGGAIRRDLFGDDGDCYIVDAALLRQLADAKLQAKAEKVRKEGWGAVEVRDEWNYDQSHKYQSLDQATREPTTAERKKVDELYRKIDALSDSDDKKAGEKIKGFRAEVKAITSGFKIKATAEVKALALAVVFVAYDGKQQTVRGLLTAAQFKALTSAGSSVKEGKIVDAKGDSVEVSTLSAALEQRLTEQRTMAARALWIANPRMALVETVYALALSHYYDTRRWTVLTVSANDSAHFSSDLSDTVAGKMLSEADEAIRAMLPASAAELRSWLNSDAVSIEQLIQIQAACTAQSIDLVQGYSKGQNRNGVNLSEGDPLALALGLNMADFFEATAENYLASVSKTLIVEAVTEAKGAEAAAPLAKMKKGEAAAAAEVLLKGSRWVPAAIR